MLLPLPYCTLDIVTAGKRVNHGGEYGPEIPVKFHFYILEKVIKLAKNKTTKLKESLKETVERRIDVL